MIIKVLYKLFFYKEKRGMEYIIKNRILIYIQLIIS